MARLVASAIGRTLHVAMPARLRHWAHAIACEIDAIEDDRAALRYAIGGLRAALHQSASHHATRLLAALLPPGVSDHSSRGVVMTFEMLRRPRTLSMLCAVAATALGVVYMAIAGAPLRYLAVNIAALAIGLLAVPALRRSAALVAARPGLATLPAGLALLATALGGQTLDGVTRWTTIGPIVLQPSLILLPLLVVAFARGRDAVATAGVVAAAAAMAMQPDLAMAGALVAGIAAIAFAKPDRWAIVALVVAAGAFVATLAQPDPMPAVPFVDRILYSAFEVHLIAGVAVVLGSALLIVPAIAGRTCSPTDRNVCAAFGMVWGATIAAAALGNYPTPLVGYGGSAVLGYLLSLSFLPDAALRRSCSYPVSRTDKSAPDDSVNLCAGFAPNR